MVGTVVGVDRDEVEAYFASRPRDAQLGAWASAQSSVVPRGPRWTQRWRRWRRGSRPTVPTPPGWGGYRVVPETWEFWAGRAGRLHDRLRYRRTGGWGDELGGRSSGSPRRARTCSDPRALSWEGTFPPQARGSGDYLGFAGHELIRAR